MSTFKVTESYTIANNTTVSLDLDTTVEYFVFSGNATLSTGDYVITTASSVTNGKSFTIWWKANATYSGSNAVSIFGNRLTQEQALTDMLIECKCSGTDVDVMLITSASDPGTRKGMNDYAIDTTGDTLTLDPTVSDKFLEVTGTGTLTGSTTIEADPGDDGDEFWILYRATMTLGAFSISIFGEVLSTDEAVSGDLVVHAIYSADDAAWKASMYKGQTLVPDKTTQTLAELGANNTTYMTPLRNAQAIAYWLLNGAKTSSVAWTFSGATPITLSNAAFTANYSLELDGSKQVVSVAKNDAYNVSFGTAAGDAMEGNDSRVINGEMHIYASFEAGKTGQISFDIQKDMIMNSAYVRVTGTLANTDAGTVTLYNGAGAITGGSQVIPLSTPFGTDYTLTLSGANATFQVGDEFRCTTAKTTSGGDILVIVYYTLQ
jgi:hypothetical protein